MPYNCRHVENVTEEGMRSETKQFNRVALDPLQLKRQVACRYCRDTFMGRTSRTVLDDNGSLAITAWTCARCGGVIEEIRILLQDGKTRPRPIRYAVAPPAEDASETATNRTTAGSTPFEPVKIASQELKSTVVMAPAVTYYTLRADAGPIFTSKPRKETRS